MRLIILASLFLSISSASFAQEIPTNGVYKVYFESGNLKEEVTYKNAEKHGSSRKYHENGKIYMEGEYVNGALKETFEKIYDSDSGIIGIMRSYYPNEFIKSEMPIAASGGEVGFCPHGTLKTYFENGKLKNSIGFDHCKEDGGVERFYENGQLREDSLYKSGEPFKVKRFNRVGEALTQQPAIHIEVDKEAYVSGDVVTIYVDNNLDRFVRFAWLYICSEKGGDWDCKTENSDLSGRSVDKGEKKTIKLKTDKLIPGKSKFRVSYSEHGEYPFFESKEFLFRK